MSNPVRELKKLLNNPQEDTIGSVVTVTENTLKLSTGAGIKEVPKSANISYQRGDKVRVFNGVAVGKIKGEDSLPVYFV